MTTCTIGSSYTLTFDAENHLTGVGDGITATFWYDGDGKRVKATIGSTTTTYIGDYFEWTGSTSTMIKYFYAGGQRVAMKKGSTVYFLFADHPSAVPSTARHRTPLPLDFVQGVAQDRLGQHGPHLRGLARKP